MSWNGRQSGPPSLGVFLPLSCSGPQRLEKVPPSSVSFSPLSFECAQQFEVGDTSSLKSIRVCHGNNTSPFPLSP